MLLFLLKYFFWGHWLGIFSFFHPYDIFLWDNRIPSIRKAHRNGILALTNKPYTLIELGLGVTFTINYIVPYDVGVAVNDLGSITDTSGWIIRTTASR